METVLGKSPEQNTNLVNLAEPFDIWFHVADISSAHLVLRNPDKLTLAKLRSSGVIYKAALQLKNSHQKFKSLSSIALNYCYIKDLKTTSVPGQVKIIGKFHVINA